MLAGVSILGLKTKRSLSSETNSFKSIGWTGDTSHGRKSHGNLRKETHGAVTYLLCSIAAWAAARRAMGTRNGEQET